MPVNIPGGNVDFADVMSNFGGNLMGVPDSMGVKLQFFDVVNEGVITHIPVAWAIA